MRPRRILVVADVVAVVLAFLSAYLALRVRGSSGSQMGITLLNCGVLLVLALMLLLRSRQYASTKRMTLVLDVGTLLRDVAIAAATTTLLSYLTKGFFTGLTTPSRVALLVMAGVFFALGSTSRLILAAVQRKQYSAGQGVRRLLLAGGGVAAAELVQLIEERPELGVKIVGHLDLDVPDWPAREQPFQDGPTASVSPDLEGMRELDRLLRESRASEVVIALDPADQARVPQLADFLGLAHVPFHVVPSLFEETYHTAELLGQTTISVIELDKNPLDRVGRLFKRISDLVFSASVLILLSPLWFITGIAVILSSGFPLIFAQERVGKNGERFHVYKFRTMVKDAEAKLEELEAHNELTDSGGRMFKMRRDPRITRVGAVLRKFSLDEIPQFYNVLKGDMSVVGPRPPLPREVSNYDSVHLYRLRVLPGITGLWQVSGRSDLSFEDMVSLDRYYVDNWSMWLDLSIVLKTFRVIVSRKGAY